MKNKGEKQRKPLDSDTTLISVKEIEKERILGRKSFTSQHNSKKVSTRAMGSP